MHSKSTSYLTAKEFKFDVKLPTGFYALRDVSSEVSARIDKFNSEERMDALSSQDSSEMPVNEIEDLDNITCDLPAANSTVVIQNVAKKTVSKIVVTKIRKRPSAINKYTNDDDDDSISTTSTKTPEKLVKDLPPAKRNKLNVSSQNSVDSTPTRRSARNKKVASPVVSEREESDNESSSQSPKKKSRKEEEEKVEPEEETATIKSMSSKKTPRKTAASAVSTPTPSAKKSTVLTTKSSKPKSPEAKRMPVRASTRNTQASK